MLEHQLPSLQRKRKCDKLTKEMWTLPQPFNILSTKYAGKKTQPVQHVWGD